MFIIYAQTIEEAERDLLAMKQAMGLSNNPMEEELNEVEQQIFEAFKRYFDK